MCSRAHAQAAASMQQPQPHSAGNMIHPASHSPLQLQAPPGTHALQCALSPSNSRNSKDIGVIAGAHHHSSRHLPEEVKTEPDVNDPQIASIPQPEEEEIPSPNHIPRGPSPEPKIEDTECHRSQSAM